MSDIPLPSPTMAPELAQLREFMEAAARTTDKTAPIRELLETVADAKLEVQVKLRDYTPTPLGPGVVERHTIAGIFKIVTDVIAHTPDGHGHRQVEMSMPFLFAADDVLWVSEPPVPKEKPLIAGVDLYGGGRRA